MREDTNPASELIDLGAATELTLGIPEQDAFEELNGEDWKE